jgi:SAM-dependent methyltransferase
MPISFADSRHYIVTSEHEHMITPRLEHRHHAERNGAVCTGCGGDDVMLFHEQIGVPALVGVQWATADEARECVRGDILLGFCVRCGLVGNVAYDPERVDYADHYDNALDESRVYRQYARAEAERLIQTGDVRESTVLDIGCGRGDFLQTLCALGNNRGVGLDPSRTPRPESIAKDERLTFVPDVYSQQHADLDAKLICCRQVLEHIAQPARLLKTVREAIGNRRDVTLYLEVPNLDDVVQRGDIWTVIYEHCSYFSRSAMKHLLTRCGFEVTHMAETFGGTFLAVDAVPVEHVNGSTKDEDRTSSLDAQSILRIVDWCTRKIHYWRSEIRMLEAEGQRIALWGAGARAVAFLNLLDIHHEIPWAVDINPRKKGHYLPGTAQQVVDPEFLKEYDPNVIIMMNPVYDDEIRSMVGKLGLHPRYLHA